MSDTRPAPRRESHWSQYNAFVVTIGAVLGIIAWFPNFQGKQQELSTYALLKDNPTGVLVVRDLGPAGRNKRRFDVNYTLVLKNNANREFDVAWSLDQLFVGTTIAPANLAPQVVNDPPNIWNLASPGMLEWREVIYDLSADPDKPDAEVVRFFVDRKKLVNAPGGGLTGTYVPGHISVHSAHYVLVASSDNSINVTITYGLKTTPSLWQKLRGLTRSSLYEDANLTGETVRLSDVAQPGCALGIAVENSQIKSACKASLL